MHFHLTVQQPFRIDRKEYVRGHLVSDKAEVDAILAGPHRHNVTQRIPSAEHISGDFHRTDDEIAARDANVKAALTASKPVK